MYKWAHLSHVFTPYLLIAPETVKCEEWPGDARAGGVSRFHSKGKTPTNLACGNQAVLPVEGELHRCQLYTLYFLQFCVLNHTLNFYTVALTLPPYVGLEACAEKMVNSGGYSGANTADRDKTIFVYFNV